MPTPERIAAKPYSETLFEVPDVKVALWLLLGGGLDEAGKEKWLAWRLEMGFRAEEIFTQALRQIGGMVAT